MKDLIDRQAAIEALEREKTYCRAFREGYAPTDVFAKYNAGLIDGIKALSSLPSAQPEIIRCKDCINRVDKFDLCQLVPGTWKADDYCSYGERK